MCLILTCIAAVLATLIHFLYPQFSARTRLDHLTFMYWGAVLMWSVDGIFRLMDGEAFFELTLNDTLLGILIVFCGVLAWSLHSLILNRR